jgi:hypothetical protein
VKEAVVTLKKIIDEEEEKIKNYPQILEQSKTNLEQGWVIA